MGEFELELTGAEAMISGLIGGDEDFTGIDEKVTNSLVKLGDDFKDLKESFKKRKEGFIGSSTNDLEHKGHPSEGVKRRFFSQAASVHKRYYTL